MEFAKSTTILTEHLGYAPIALIDDVINAVNDILYKCTAAMETFLSERYGNDENIPEDEIELGTAKLETLLESVVDKCFDKFELYVLRNLLIIPPDFIKGGWIRLEHQQGVDFSSTGSMDKIIELRKQLYEQKHLNYLLKTRCKRTAKLLTMLDGYRSSLQGLKNQPHLISQIAPLNETIQFLTSQVTQMMNKIQSQKSNGNENNNRQFRKIEHNSRDVYVDHFAKRALESMDLDIINNTTSINSEQALQAEKLAQLLEEK